MCHFVFGPEKGVPLNLEVVDFQYDIAKTLRIPKMYMMLAIYISDMLKCTNQANK